MATRRLATLIRTFCEAPGAERNLYYALKRLLIDGASPCAADAGSIVIDSPIPGTRCAPDLTLYLLGDKAKPILTASHVFAVVEVKPGNRLDRDEQEILREKYKYVTSTTRFLYLVDQTRVVRHQVLPGGAAGARDAWQWSDLEDAKVLKIVEN